MNPSDARKNAESIWAWANEQHAQVEKALRLDDPLNMHLIPHKDELTTMLSAYMGIMLAQTDTLDDLAAIEEAKDEMKAAARSNAKREGL